MLMETLLKSTDLVGVRVRVGVWWVRAGIRVGVSRVRVGIRFGDRARIRVRVRVGARARVRVRSTDMRDRKRVLCMSPRL